MFDAELLSLAQRLIHELEQRGLLLATAESCTGGLICAALTSIPGASAVLDRGFVTYSNEAKIEMLGVHAELINEHGAVSQEVARAMAAGALVHSEADVAISVTGIAGPGGGSEEKPVGLVHIAVARIDGPTLHLERRYGARDRTTVRFNSLRDALDLGLEALAAPSSATIE